jgi:ubiquinone/menaquinone biosynthesis C-methylase UbiE
MTKWDKFFDEKIKEIAKGSIVLDVGGCSRFQKSLGKYEKYFSNCNYKTIDFDSKCNPDILADIHNIPLPDNYADSVICKSVLEHVKEPIKVTEEIYRVLKNGGKCFVYVPFIHVYHGNDYWRFSEDTIKYIFRKFNHIEIVPVLGHFETIATLLPYNNKFPVSLLVFLARILDKMFCKFQSGKQVSGYNIFLIK